MTGLILFIISTMPSYISFVRKRYISVCAGAKYKQSVRYDDELVQNIKLALYDIRISQPMSMERQGLNTYLIQLRNTLNNRYNLYTNMLKKNYDGSTSMYDYCQRRAEEFSELLHQLPPV